MSSLSSLSDNSFALGTDQRVLDSAEPEPLPSIGQRNESALRRLGLREKSYPAEIETGVRARFSDSVSERRTEGLLIRQDSSIVRLLD